MKKTLLAMALTLGLGLVAYSQPADKSQHTPEERAEKMTERMAHHLELTEDQKNAVYEANFQLASAQKEDRKANMEKHDANLKEILNEEQYEKWQASNKNMKGRREKRQKHQE